MPRRGAIWAGSHTGTSGPTPLAESSADFRFGAVRLTMHVEESGPNKQGELADALHTEPYAMSRLLKKLELHGYMTRQLEGSDGIVESATVGR